MTESSVRNSWLMTWNAPKDTFADDWINLESNISKIKKGRFWSSELTANLANVFLTKLQDPIFYSLIHGISDTFWILIFLWANDLPGWLKMIKFQTYFRSNGKTERYVYETTHWECKGWKVQTPCCMVRTGFEFFVNSLIRTGLKNSP